jgi:pimeloyl-ACP methyl ester carboxylesterase|tara:strand:+ start:9889 stop:11025 length:1137 start_codon:yes stop_codon:yes gene_type:complete
MSDIKELQINISQTQIDDLKTRLQLARFPEAEVVDDWSQGIPLNYVREVTDYWLHQYDFRRLANRLNALPNFTTELDGLPIHFLHVRSPEANAKPMIMTHGWPGSVVEFLKVIGPLTDPEAHGGDAADAFHLVCPSLPGFGFSGKPTTTGWGLEKIGAQWAQLMARLGYGSYFAQGGDWGSMVSTSVAVADPEHCVGIHVNMAIATPDPETMGSLTPSEESALASMKFYQDWDSGYSKQQSTRPQTIGYSLVDSPVGQMAWILEKFYAWTDCKGHPENVLTRDEMLDNVMVYWLNAAGASSARLYWESFNGGSNDSPITVPFGASVFPHEIFRTSERWLEKRYTNLVYFNELETGGHFAAFEQPEAFIGEVRNCFRLF